jgi:antitoxin ParD1/3/4
MNISLTPELVKFVQQEVEGGLYQTASEVVRAALRRLKSDQKVMQPELPETLEELEQRLIEGLDAIERGEVMNGKECFRRLRRKIKAATSNG